MLVGESDEDRDERRDEDGRTEIVDTRRLRARATSGQRAPDDGEDDGADGQIHEEHPLPADGVGDDPADRRADERAQPEDRADEALVLAALRRVEQVADDRKGDREERPGAEALERAKADELPHFTREPRQRGADEEDPDREEEYGTSTEEVRELAVDRAADRGRQQVGGEGPGVDLVPVKIGHDARERRPDDRLIERREE